MPKQTLSFFEDVVQTLTKGETHKVWSILISIFGDLAREPGDEISSPLLTEMTKELGIKPEAMRVALHRLRKDNWIDRRREGRLSIYFLSSKGYMETNAASPKIYAKTTTNSSNWHLIINNQSTSKNSSRSHNKNYTRIAPNCFLGMGLESDFNKNEFVFQGQVLNVPDWMKNLVFDRQLNKLINDLEIRLTTLSRKINNAENLSEIQSAILRSVLVHCWRRVALRIPNLPNNFFNHGWKGDVCRDLFLELITKIKKPSIKNLEKILH